MINQRITEELVAALREALKWMEPASYSPGAAKARAMVQSAIDKAAL